MTILPIITAPCHGTRVLEGSLVRIRRVMSRGKIRNEEVQGGKGMGMGVVRGQGTRKRTSDPAHPV